MELVNFLIVVVFNLIWIIRWGKTNYIDALSFGGNFRPKWFSLIVTLYNIIGLYYLVKFLML